MPKNTMDGAMRSSNDDIAKSELRDNKGSGPWAKAIEEATEYGFALENERHQQQHHGNPSKASSFSVEEGIHRVDHSLIFLEDLQLLLEQQEYKEWPPMRPSHPPTFTESPGDRQDDSHTTRGRGGSPSSRKTASNAKTQSISSTSAKTSKKKKKKKFFRKKSHRRMNRSLSKNRYATIAFDSDEGSHNDSDIEAGTDAPRIDSHESDSKARTSTMKIEKSLSAEADPYVPSLSFGEDTADHGGGMDTMRILIRLHASQSDLHAMKARLLAAQRKWLLGAGSLQSAIVALAKGLELAEKAISAIDVATDMSHTITTTSTTGGWAEYCSPQEIMASYNVPAMDGVPSMIAVEDFTDHRRAQLQNDAEITSMSTDYLVTEKDRYIKLAHRELARLEKILQPMWKSRDLAKKRIGKSNWNSNPNPKPSYLTKTRRRHEEELWALEEALKQLEFSQETTFSLVEEANHLRERLKQLRFAKNRYNGLRPARSSPQTVVDPERTIETEEPSYLEVMADEYGWAFTGSIGGIDCVQFFEKWIDMRLQESPAVPKSICLPSLSIQGDDPTNPNSGSVNPANTGMPASFVLVKLDYYFLTGAVQTVVEYPITYNDEGILVQNAWSSTLQFHVDKGDTDGLAMYRQILMNPLMAHRLHGGTNVALMHS